MLPSLIVVIALGLSFTNAICATANDLHVCKHLNGKEVFYVGIDFWGTDRKIEFSNYAAVPSDRLQECRDARIRYQCEATYPTCINGKPTMPCRKLCLDIVEKCPAKFRGGLSEALCVQMDETECSGANALTWGIIPLLLFFVVL